MNLIWVFLFIDWIFSAEDYEFQKVEQEKLTTAKTKLPTAKKTTVDSASDSEDDHTGPFVLFFLHFNSIPIQNR
jgi:hypothetical protein